MLPYLIFSDLDSTLLDHHDYSFTKAEKALKIVEKLQIPLILNSSKTAAEISEIKTKMTNNHPFIVENGGVIFIPDHYFSENTPCHKIILGPARNDILWRLHILKNSYHFKFKSFNEYSCEELSEETGLNQEQAAMAKDRMASEPLKWLGDIKSLELFKQELSQHGLKLIQGGRFFHVMGYTDKGLAMLRLVEHYQQKYLQPFKIIAAGDSPNDLQMLEQADFAAVICPFEGTCLPLDKDSAYVFNSKKPAPAGWQETMMKIFKQLKLEI